MDHSHLFDSLAIPPIVPEFRRAADLRLLDGINDINHPLREVSFGPPYRRWGRGPEGEWELLQSVAELLL